jgi:hypothetical protein
MSRPTPERPVSRHWKFQGFEKSRLFSDVRFLEAFSQIIHPLIHQFDDMKGGIWRLRLVPEPARQGKDHRRGLYGPCPPLFL